MIESSKAGDVIQNTDWYPLRQIVPNMEVTFRLLPLVQPVLPELQTDSYTVTFLSRAPLFSN